MKTSAMTPKSINGALKVNRFKLEDMGIAMSGIPHFLDLLALCCESI